MKDLFVILSADKSVKSEAENRVARSLLGKLLKQAHLEGWLGTGFYEGAQEECCYVRVDGNELALDFLRDAARHFYQESILVVNEAGDARLEFLSDGSTVDLGKWIEIDEVDKAKYAGWALLGGKIYTTTGSAR